MAYIVSWRTREIGVRIAMGASKWQIVRMVVRQCLIWAITGSIAGVLAAVASARVLQRFLFEVSTFDPLTLYAVPLLMLLLATLAAWLPARRAASINPVQALRME
jgi:ABC-type antimicrobial peptide transport system permease subunit